MKCNKKNCPLVGNNENCDIKDCKWRTEDAVDSDLIRRSDAIRTIAKKLEWELETDMNNKVAEWLNEVSAVEPCKDAPKQGEWIPCEERLPNDGECCLISVNAIDDIPYEVVISDNVSDLYERGWATAWMPLPEPWKGADDE